MIFPKMSELPRSRDALTTFRGVNMTPSVGDGEFASMQNMGGDQFPVLSPRERRRIVPKFAGSSAATGDTFAACNGISSMDGKLLVVDGTHVWWDHDDRGDVVENTPKQLVRMGADTLIFPDHKIINSIVPNVKNMQKTSSVVGPSMLTVKICDREGNGILIVSSDTPPTGMSLITGMVWEDTSETYIGGGHPLYRYSSETESWDPFKDFYHRVEVTTGAHLDLIFSVGDYITIEFSYNIQGQKKFSGEVMAASSFIADSVTHSYLAVDMRFPLNSYMTVGTGYTINFYTYIPDFGIAFCESNNRAWGCKSDGHEIYACRLGEPRIWNDYSALSTASIAITVGTEGEFTGAVNVNGNPVFFKENTIHVITGKSVPFGMVAYEGWRGVQKGCERSVAVINGICYYKGVDGIYAFDGAQVPVLISRAITGEWTDAVGGADGDKYFVSMKDSSGNWSVFVYGTQSGMWHREDGVHISYAKNVASNSLFVVGQKLYSRNNYAGIDTLTGSGPSFVAVQEEAFDWYAESGDVLALLPDRKYISQIQITLELSEDSALSVEFQYDHDGVWRPGISLTGVKTKGIVTIPVIPRRCQYFRYKISGNGDAKVYSMSKVLEQGA